MSPAPYRRGRGARSRAKVSSPASEAGLAYLEKNATAQRTGAAFERDLQHLTHFAYQKAGLAWMQKLPVATAPVQGIRGVISREDCDTYQLRRRAKKAGFDYFGLAAVLEGQLAVAVAMEAKCIGGPTDANPEPSPMGRIAVVMHEDDSRRGVERHQLKALAEWQGFGGIAALVWKTGVDWVGVLHGEALRAAWLQTLGGRDHIPRDEFGVVPKRTIAGVYCDDWLGAIVGSWR